MNEEKQRRYGDWRGNPGGSPEDITHCIEAIVRDNNWWTSQCSRKRGHGKDGLYCKQHAKQYPEAPDENT